MVALQDSSLGHVGGSLCASLAFLELATTKLQFSIKPLAKAPAFWGAAQPRYRPPRHLDWMLADEMDSLQLICHRVMGHHSMTWAKLADVGRIVF